VPTKSLPDQPNLEQYKKQAKDLVRAHAQATPDALDRIMAHHPRFRNQPQDPLRLAPFQLSDAQLVIAREHGFESWPKFAQQIETLRLTRSVASLDDPVSAFIEAASIPRNGHRSGTIEEANMILQRYPYVATSSVFAAALLADETSIRGFLARDPGCASAKGGTRGWDPLTYLCFSRYLRLDPTRTGAFVRAARALLDAGAPANTGWPEMIDHPNPQPIIEAAIYGAAGIAQHADLTRLLLDRGADPNDEETPYHVAETRDNAVLKVLIESRKLNERSINTLLLRKCDWHDFEGVRMMLEHGANPNSITIWGVGALHQAVGRDNHIKTLELLLDYGADPTLPDRHGFSAIAIAARRGRDAAIDLFEHRGYRIELKGIDALIAACARDHKDTVRALISVEPQLKEALLAQGGRLLAQFSGVGHLTGVRNLLDLGVNVAELYREGDGYFGIAADSTALHVAAWRARPEVVKELISRGAPVNATDAQGRTPLQLAVKACVDSYWTDLRSPDSVRALLDAGASTDGIDLPTGYDEIDKLLVPRAIE
jgi:ankyrin repeat protein